MFMHKHHHEEPKHGLENNKLVAVAIDKDKGSQCSLKWAIDHLVHKGQTLVLIHVRVKPPGFYSNSNSHSSSRPAQALDITNNHADIDNYTKEVFLPFRCFCTRKDIKCQDIVIEDTDVVTALVEYVTQSAIEILVLGSPTKHGFFRKFQHDIPTSVTKGLPDFCTVYVISKGKISSTRAATRPAPLSSALRNQIKYQSSIKSDHHPETPRHPPGTPRHLPETPRHRPTSTKGAPKFISEPTQPRHKHNDVEFIKSPFTHRKGPTGISYAELPAPESDISYVGSRKMPESDISYVSSGRPSVDRRRHHHHHPYDSYETGRSPPPPLSSHNSDSDFHSYESMCMWRKSIDTHTPPPEFSSVSHDSDRSDISSQTLDEAEAEMRRLKQELKQTMEMYSSACKEALSANNQAKELQRWKREEEQRLEESKLAEESALAIVERERAKLRAAMEHAEAAQRLAELEAQRRINAEMRALHESEEKNRVLKQLADSDVRYRRYSIEEIESATNFFAESRKIGEGGYGPVYKCYLDHTHVAVKVLRPDAAQGRSQFQQEVEILSCIRHPNMVLLLGACPEYGCLVYEYMHNGSLEDRLHCRGHSSPLSWQYRFRIAAEIATALHFLHHTKPEPLVHRDLKPGNILLDRNFTSKISDVGLARLVPPSIANDVTQYRMTQTAGTFCYIDPEYQQTGMLCTKSDIYSLGVLLLQLITAKPPMGLTHYVGRAIERGTLSEMLDPRVQDWPIEEATEFAKMALRCAELRRKDRPDLESVVLPELERLRDLAEEHMPHYFDGTEFSPRHSQVSMSQVGSSFPSTPHSAHSYRSRVSTGA